MGHEATPAAAQTMRRKQQHNPPRHRPHAAVSSLPRGEPRGEPPTSGGMSLTLSKGAGSWPLEEEKTERKGGEKGKEEAANKSSGGERSPERHSSRLMTCSLRVMMDKDFSRWDEIKIYTRCFLTQLVGRSSSFHSISAAGDGHPERGLSNGAVSWQNPKNVPLAHLERCRGG